MPPNALFSVPHGLEKRQKKSYHARKPRPNCVGRARSVSHLSPDPSRGERLAVVGLHVDAASSDHRPGRIRRLKAVPRFAPHGMLSASRRKHVAEEVRHSLSLTESCLKCSPRLSAVNIDDLQASAVFLCTQKYELLTGDHDVLREPTQHAIEEPLAHHPIVQREQPCLLKPSLGTGTIGPLFRPRLSISETRRHAQLWELEGQPASVAVHHERPASQEERASWMSIPHLFLSFLSPVTISKTYVYSHSRRELTATASSFGTSDK